MEREQAFFRNQLEPTSFWNKLTGKKLDKNAVVEINNLLADKPLLEVQPEEVQKIMDKYHMNLFNDFDDGSLRELYKTYLRYCFDDNHLDDDEITRLRHLKRVLGLSDKAVEIANHQICYEVYERELESALEDYHLDEKEATFLKNLQRKLHLPQEIADSIYQKKAQSIIINFIKGAIEDERLSPDEEQELEMLIQNLDVEPKLDPATQADLAKFRLLWQMENGELPDIHTPVKLKKNEKCFFLADAHWYLDKGKSPKSRVFNLKTKLIKGTYWKIQDDSLDLQNKRWKEKAEGKTYITNQRIIFRSNNKEESVELQSLQDYINYPEGVYLNINGKKNQLIHLSNNRDVFSMILGRVLRDL